MNEEKLLQPRLRFLGFEALCWDNKSLGEVVNFYSGLTYSPSNIVRSNGTLVLRSSNVQNGRLAFEDNVYVESKVVNSNNVKVGDIVVVVRNGSKSLIGKHTQILTPMPNTVIGAFMTGIRTDQSKFVNALLDTPLFKKAVEKNLGATINQITTGAFKEMEFHFSSSDKEQTKIGNFFTNTDQQLILHQSKLTKLQQLKKAMLGKLFPKKGSIVPEIRFTGFNESWKELTLKNVCTEFKSGKFIRAKEIKKTGMYPVYGGNGIRGYHEHYNHNGVYALIGRQGALCGNMNISYGKAYFTEHAIAVKANELHDTIFLYHKLKLMNLGQYSGQSAQPGLSVTKLLELPILLPTKHEQRKIGEYFHKLDRLIALQQKQISKLENIKQSFLEKMFV